MKLPNKDNNFEKLFGHNDIHIAGAKLCTCLDSLHDKERGLVAFTAPKRQHEFATGRVLARKLLKTYDITDFALLNDKDRVPVWPEGIKGSISHCDTYCAVAITQNSSVSGLGLDVEPNAPLECELWPHLLTQEELHWLEGHPVEEQGALVRLFFSAKEAAYKALFPQTRAFLDFQDLELTFDFAKTQFNIETTSQAINGYLSDKKIDGFFYQDSSYIVTGAIVSNTNGPFNRRTA